MADGSSEDDLDWFERAVRDETAGSDGADADGENSESAEPDASETAVDEAGGAPAEGAGRDMAEEPGDIPGPRTGTEPGEEMPQGSEGAGADMDEIAEAFGMDAAPGAEGIPDSGGGGEFGFNMDSAAGAGEDFGFGVGQRAESFEEEEYQTDVPRIDIGIEGLDEMIQEGIPERALLVAIGGAGTGKTTFGLQFLNQSLENDERAVFITLEESHDRIIQNAHVKGWAFEEYEEAGDLAVVDLDPVNMANSLTSIRSELPRLVEEFGASRLVLDSVSLLEMMYEDQATRRTEIYDFARSLKAAGVTTLLTSESDEDNPFASRFGVIEYLTDGVFVLRYVRPEDFRETRLAIEIQKIRDANHSRETKPYEITSTGISVYRQANIF